MSELLVQVFLNYNMVYYLWVQHYSVVPHVSFEITLLGTAIVGSWY